MKEIIKEKDFKNISDIDRCKLILKIIKGQAEYKQN